MKDLNIIELHCKPDRFIPNNQQLPVMIYKSPLGKNVKNIEKVFNQHQWLNSWTNGVYNYHHYHSNTHEVLGVVAGEAVLKIGGESGEDIFVNKGDVLVLPAGTGHKRLSSSQDFKVVGAYPEGMNPNLKTEDQHHEKYRKEIEKVSIPSQDPVFGVGGPLFHYWEKKLDK